MVFLYFRSHIFVPVAKRVALLEVGKSDPLIGEGTWVKIRNRLYQDDIAKVVSVIGTHNTVVVELKSRETLPNISNSKRKWGDSRPRPYLLTKDKATGIGDWSRIVSSDNGFTFRGKSYTTDGHLLLQICCDRVQRVSSGIAVHDSFVASESANAVEHRFKPKPKTASGTVEPHDSFHPSSVPVSIPLFLNIGDHIFIIEGEAKGAKGTINQLSPNEAVVTLDEMANSDLTKIDYVQTDLKHITRLFDFGEHVQIKVGTFAGRSGTVGDIHGRGNTLYIIDRD